ncbi:hypothetical protein HG434_002090 [Candidatus Saccharibacteria bacterium]|nr:hypothetical protein [Candidatus Saccharibacteria bacterium]
MSRVVTAELGLAPTAVADNGGGFDVFSSLRDGAGGEEFSSGIGEGRSADTDEAASSLDLVAVASGEAELNTVTNSKPESKETSAPVNPEQCQKYGTIACIGCGLRQFCEERQAAMMAGNTEVQPGEQLSTLEQLLREDDAPGEIVWARPSPDDFDGGELPVADSPRVIETSADKTDGPTEKITPQEQESKASTSEPVEVLGDDVDAEVAEALFFGLKTTPEIAADDTKDVGESQPESANEISDEGPFIEVTEVSSPPAEMKPHVIDASSAAAHDNNKQPTLEPLDTPAQTETAPASLAINEGKQTGGENSNPLKNETVCPMANEDKVTASVVENTYNGDETTAPSSVKTPSIEHQKENDFVITGSKSANSEPSRAVENDESATPVFEQQHLAAQSDAVKADESAITELIDNSGTKASTDIQPSELNIDAALDYNDFVESIDSVEQPKHVIPTAANVPPSQEQEDAGNVSVEYETNETSTEEVVSMSVPIPAKEQPDQPAIMLSSIEDGVEYGESSLSVSEESPADHGPTRPDIVNEPTTHGVIEVTHETDETIGLEAMNVTLPAAAVTVSEGKNQIDLPPKLNEELVVDKRVYETQTSLVEQLYHDDATVECSHGKDNEFWAEEDTVFFVEQQSPAVEPEVSSAEVVTIALPMEAITVCEEADDLKLSVGDDMDSVGQLDNSKVASVPEITNDYESVEQIAILASPATEPIPDIELDAAVESELGEQNDSAVASAVDSYGYNSETSAASDNILVVKNYPSLGLWSDDSRLNPEEESTTTTQSSADDTSLVLRLVGVLVVAMCVARGRQASAILSSR